MRAAGTPRHWDPTITSYRSMRRPASRPVDANILPRPPQPHQPMRVEAEYERRGAWAYFAAWDVHRARIFGRCEPTTGIVPFYRLVDQVMSQQPYRSARRVFWIVDNGSSRRGQRSIRRLQERWPNAILIHTPVHASWMNQIEIYFSIVQRKVSHAERFPNPAGSRIPSTWLSRPLRANRPTLPMAVQSR